MSEALGRMAGPGMMKGESPVPPKRQADAAIEVCIHQHLPDSAGALRSVLVRQVKDCDLLLDGLDTPLAALKSYVLRALSSKHMLKELVREADVEWGQALGERPFFETDGPPQPEDPYTLESVSASLRKLVEQL